MKIKSEQQVKRCYKKAYKYIKELESKLPSVSGLVLFPGQTYISEDSKLGIINRDYKNIYIKWEKE